MGDEITVTSRTVYRIPFAPVPVQVMLNILGDNDPDATVTIQPQEGGSQRDPVVTGYLITVES